MVKQTPNNNVTILNNINHKTSNKNHNKEPYVFNFS